MFTGGELFGHSGAEASFYDLMIALFHLRLSADDLKQKQKQTKSILGAINRTLEDEETSLRV